MRRLTTITILLCLTFLITSFSLTTETAEQQAGEIHYAKIVNYKQFGQLQTDTLCLNDSLWIKENEHREIPEFMEDSLWSFRAEPSLIKIRAEKNNEEINRIHK